MAYDTVAKLKEKGNENILNQLAAGVNPPDQKRGKLHEVFEASFDIKEFFVYIFHPQPCHYYSPISSIPQRSSDESINILKLFLLTSGYCGPGYIANSDPSVAHTHYQAIPLYR